jgi:L-glyceraldehyde reductase
MPLTKDFKMNNGLTIPAVGLGTWVSFGAIPEINLQLATATIIIGDELTIWCLVQRQQQSQPNEVKNAVEFALKAGYRHIDAAAAYNNEREVGDGIKASGVPREEIFVSLASNHDTYLSLFLYLFTWS